MNRKQVGQRGEGLAAAFLRRQGFHILEQNYRSSLGEIDLVCQDSETVVFVEVKSRTGSEFAEPWASVGVRKQRKLRRLAEEYLINHRLESRQVRFDVLSIVLGNDRPRIEHLPGAF